MRTHNILLLLILALLTAIGCEKSNKHKVTPQETVESPCSTAVVYSVSAQQDAVDLLDDLMEDMDPISMNLKRKWTKKIRWALIKFSLVGGEQENFGYLRLNTVTDFEGDQVMVYRTGLTSMPERAGSCLHWLVTAGDAKHVINLYKGDMDVEKLLKSESRQAQNNGATYFNIVDYPELATWRKDIEDSPGDKAVMDAAVKTVAKILNEQVLRPNGQAPRGNVYMHCGGGMHRTGMLMGILDRCVNGTPMERITATYKRHVDYEGPEKPGGYEPENLEFIERFPCNQLVI